jgi:outer membrane lipoprotein-sorting protein
MRLIAIVGLSLVGWWSAQAETPALLPYKSAHWKQTLNIKAAKPDQVMKLQAELWFSSPDRMRVTVMIDGRQRVIIVRGGVSFLYEDGSDEGMKMPLQKQMIDQTTLIAEFLSKQDAWKKAKTGSEEVGGRTCDVYPFTDTSGGKVTKGKVWLWADKNFPLRIIQESEGQSVIIEHSDVQINEDVSPTIFQIPTGVKFSDVPTGSGK